MSFDDVYIGECVSLLSRLESMHANERAEGMTEALSRFDDSGFKELYDLMDNVFVKEGPFSIDFSNGNSRIITVQTKNENTKIYYAPSWGLTYEYYDSFHNVSCEHIRTEKNNIYADSVEKRIESLHASYIFGLYDNLSPDLLKSMIYNFDSFEKSFYAECNKILKAYFLPCEKQIYT